MKFRMFPKEYGLVPALWLIYTVFPIYYLIQLQNIKGLIGLLLMGFFLCLYRDNFWTSKRHFSNVVMMTGIIFVFILCYNEGFLYTALYISNSIAYLQSLKKFWFSYGLQILLSLSLFLMDLLDFKEGLNYSYISPAMIMIIVIPAIARYQMKWSETKQELAQANKQIEELIKQRERERIARDLHDTVGQTLSMITLKSEIAYKLVKKDVSKSESEMKEIHQISRTVLKQIREIISDLKYLSFSEEVSHSSNVLSEVGIYCRIEGSVNISGINQLYESILSYALKESITNVIRHSYATHCTIKIEESNENLILEVIDNGKTMLDDIIKGNGLIGMEERVNMVSGEVVISSGEPNGCSVKVIIPKVKSDSVAVS